MIPTLSRQASRARRGYTLLELVMASVSMSVLMAASVALLGLVTAAMPTHVSSRGKDAAGVADTLASRIERATAITAASPRRIDLVVPDEDGDIAPETYEYAWGGSPGDPLVVRRNGVGATQLLDGVESFAVAPGYQTSTQQQLLFEQVGTEREWAWEPLFPISLTSWAVDQQKVLVLIQPNLPSGAVRWSAERITLQFASSNWTDEVEVAFYITNSGVGGIGDPVAETIVTSADLDGSNRAVIDWLNTPELLATQRFAVTVESRDDSRDSGTPALRIATDLTGSASGFSADIGGDSYRSSGLVIPVIYVHGRAIFAGSIAETTTDVYKTVNFQILGSPQQATEYRAVPLRNRPAAPAAVNR